MQVAAEVKQIERAQAAATLAAMMKFKLAQAFAAWRQHCRRSQVGCQIFLDTLLCTALLLGKLDTLKGVLAAGKAAHSHLSEHDCSTCSITSGFSNLSSDSDEDVLQSPIPDLVSGSSVSFSAWLAAAVDQPFCVVNTLLTICAAAANRS